MRYSLVWVLISCYACDSLQCKSCWRIRRSLCEVKKWKHINRRASVACVRPQEEAVKKTKPVRASNEERPNIFLLSVVEPRQILTWHRFRFSSRLSLTWTDPNPSNLCPECQLLPVCALDSFQHLSEH